MPLQSSPNSLDKLNDSILGVFSKFPESERLDHAVRFLSTWNGSELSSLTFWVFSRYHTTFIVA